MIIKVLSMMVVIMIMSANLQKVMVIERLMSPPKSAVQKLLPVPPGLEEDDVDGDDDHDDKRADQQPMRIRP